ncbi:hypothetical protein Glove_349g133 [Diversispora epigaea]|uniref:Uncharacterized protein n=1 Tax=Diversispora epigaea TaxID=1348612 RepID=A0A397HJ41_9GLOM|nr:hypothetical protein Glove_349g133 [Diversispora epigaea]
MLKLKKELGKYYNEYKNSNTIQINEAEEFSKNQTAVDMTTTTTPNDGRKLWKSISHNYVSLLEDKDTCDVTITGNLSHYWYFNSRPSNFIQLRCYDDHYILKTIQQNYQVCQKLWNFKDSNQIDNGPSIRTRRLIFKKCRNFVKQSPGHSGTFRSRLPLQISYSSRESFINNGPICENLNKATTTIHIYAQDSTSQAINMTGFHTNYKARQRSIMKFKHII